MKAIQFSIIVLLFALTAYLVGAVSAQGPGPQGPPPPVRLAVAQVDSLASSRQGAWLDTIVFSVEDSATNAIARLQADDLDLYASSIGSGPLFQTILEDPNLAYSESYGGYNELTINPYGPIFNDGRLNPFSSTRIREAVNRLVDRAYIAQVIGGGLARPRWVPVHSASSDYTRYAATIQALEAQYAYNLAQAQTDIADEIQALDAYLQNGTWHYNGQQIVLILLIREDLRRQIGDYVADQLEEVGFAVDRWYVTGEQASPIWLRSDPAEGQWHIYTGGWITTQVSRNEGNNFAFFYTPSGLSVPLWQAYRPTAEFDEVARKLANNNFSTIAEQDTLFEQALSMALNDRGSAVPEGAGSVRVWLADWSSLIPRRSELAVVSDSFGGVGGAQMWPYAIRFVGQEGGTARIAQPGLLVDRWNPVAGSNWIYDTMPIRATQDYAFIADPNNGLVWPQHAERAEVVVREGLPVTKTLDWVDHSFTPQITVPADAWVDWDAENQRFITRAEKYPDGLTATVKSTVYYPSNLFTTVTWHDGSPLDLSDFVMSMILTFDRGKPESAIYDPSAEPGLNAFLEHFRGVRIISEQPLVIETYDDAWQLDAELMVQGWWPNYGYGPGAWHNLAIAIRAEAAGELAFSADKKENLGVPQTDFVAGDSLTILADYLDQAIAQSYIPYSPTLGTYITQDEADTRWAALQNWYNTYSHFWIGTGPFYLDEVIPDEPRLVLQRYPNFPDPAGRWDTFVAAENPEMQINFSSGALGSYFNLTGSGFPPDSTAFVVANGHLLGEIPVDSSGAIAFTLAMNEATQGIYHLRVSVNPAAGVQFRLSPNEPVRQREGNLPVIEVPAGLINVTYLPLVLDNR